MLELKGDLFGQRSNFLVVFSLQFVDFFSIVLLALLKLNNLAFQHHFSFIKFDSNSFDC